MRQIDSARRAFLQARSSAERRGIPWRLTFDEWWAVWAPHWERRAEIDMDMCRTGDVGAYEMGNVRIDTHAANVGERSAICAALPIQAGRSLPERIERLERAAVARALALEEGNQTRAAARLGITFRSFRYMRHKYLK